MPTHEVAVPASQPSCQPPPVLIMLDGIGRKISVANKPMTTATVTGVEVGCLDHSSAQASNCEPNARKGTIGTNKTMLIRIRGRTNEYT